MARTIGGHYLTHMLEERLAVFRLVHVDEIDHDDAAHVAEPKLARDLVGGADVYVESVCLLVVTGFGAVAGIHVDYVEGLRMLDNDVCA